MGAVLDLRGTPTWERHSVVFSAFSDLRDHETLHLIYDFEPRPLRRRFEDTFSQRFLWSQRRVGSERWEVSLRKLPPLRDLGSTADFISRCPIFATSCEATRRALAGVAQPRAIRRKTILAEQESYWPFLGIVRRGKIFAIVATSGGRDQILFEAMETEVFGNMVVFDGGETIARFATLADAADVLLFPRSAVLQAAEADSRFAIALAAAAMQQMRAVVELLDAHVSKKTIARVAGALLPYAPTEQGLAAVHPAHVPSLRLTQIAAATGSVKEVVARAVAELESVGALRRSRGHIAYIDRAKLASFAS
jgi:CRP/FNR family cyclic AMP-dependent transcriptional regulator